MAHYKKWCHENADGTFKAGQHSGNCKNIKAALTEVPCKFRRLGPKEAPTATKEDCPKEMANYKKWCHENADGTFKAGQHSGNCKTIKKVLTELKCESLRLGPKEAPTATKEDCPKEMANYKKWCNENADGTFKAGQHNGNCKTIKKVLTDLDCTSTRLALSKGS